MDENDENDAVCEKHGLSELETKLMESVAAGVPQDGTPAYFDWASIHYGIMPDKVARAKFVEKLVSDNFDWIGLKSSNGSVKVLDYGAGTGFFSQAFVPHATQILAIDNSRGMVDQYNKLAAANQDKIPRCDMRAVQGDLIDRYDLRQDLDPEIADPDGDYHSFDLVVMCLAIDCFVTDASSDIQYMELVNALEILSARLKDKGLLIIMDIEKVYGYANFVDEASMDGRKEEGNGSREVVAALKDIGMEDIAVIEDQDFSIEVELFGQKRKIHEKYFMVRAVKGEEDGD